MTIAMWVGGAFVVGIVSGLVGGALIWRKNAATLTQDAQKMSAVASDLKKL